jgi:hypothetical protein
MRSVPWLHLELGFSFVFLSSLYPHSLPPPCYLIVASIHFCYHDLNSAQPPHHDTQDSNVPFETPLKLFYYCRSLLAHELNNKDDEYSVLLTIWSFCISYTTVIHHKGNTAHHAYDASHIPGPIRRLAIITQSSHRTRP